MSTDNLFSFFKLITKTNLDIIAVAINKSIAQSTTKKKQKQKILSKVIGINFSDISFILYCVILEDKILLMMEKGLETDITINCSLTSLFTFLSLRDIDFLFLTETINIEQDKELFFDILAVFRNLKLNWQTTLLKITNKKEVNYIINYISMLILQSKKKMREKKEQFKTIDKGVYKGDIKEFITNLHESHQKLERLSINLLARSMIINGKITQELNKNVK